MGKVTGFEHGLYYGSGVEGVAGLGRRDGEETKGVGIEAVELAFIAEALDNGLGA